MSTNDKNISVSLCMIVKNEEEFLSGCLESVQGIVDEIVIVDTGSIDNTVAIAEKYGARIFHFDWVGDFSAARNESLRHAKGDWILYLDADERLMDTDKDYLGKLIKQKNVGGYYVTVFGYQQYRDNRQPMSMKYPRLFKKGKYIKFEGKVHEQIYPSINRAGLPINISNLKINHLGYDISWEVVEQKCLRNIELLRKQLENNPDDFYTKFQIGNTLNILGKTEAAEKELSELLTLKRVNNNIYAATYNILGANRVKEEKFNEGVECFNRSLKYADYQVMGRWFLARVFNKLERYADAVSNLAEIEEILNNKYRPKNNILPAYDLHLDKTVLFEEMIEIMLKMGEFQTAGEILKRIDVEGITSYKLQKFAAQVALKENDIHSAFRQLKKMRSVVPPERKDILERIDMLEKKLSGR